MSPINMLTKFFRPRHSGKSLRRRDRRRQLGIESLDKRQLQAIDVSLDSLGMLRIIGDDQHNYADVMQMDGAIEVYTVRNRLDDVPDEALVHRFNAGSVKQLYFDGRGGSDYLINRTALPATMFGGEGDDILLAGTGRNQLYGEAGLDDVSKYGKYNVEESAPRISDTLRGPQDQSPLAIYYRQLQDAATVLGKPTNDGEEYGSPNGQAKMRTYENGVIVWTAGHGAVHMVGNILKKWESLGGFNNSVVGNPITKEGLYSISNMSPTSDTVQRFEHGVIMHRPTVNDGTFAVYGEIFKKWMEPSKDSRTPSVLTRVGLPRSDEMPTSPGQNRESRFDRGTIVWNRASNTTSINSPNGLKLVSLGNALNNKLLFLTSVAPARLGGLSMATTTNDFYIKLGREKGVLGGQTAGEKLIGGKMVFVTTFRFGAIYRTMNSIFEVHGDIYKKYVQTGGPSGALGLPRTNETAVGDAAGGRFNTFEHGEILWTPARGAFEVHGDIWRTWNSRGGVKSTLGYPTSDERDVSVNSEYRISHFQNGAIAYRDSSIVLEGLPWQQWTTYGSDKSCLGAPTRASELVSSVVNGRLGLSQRMEFEGGTLTVRTGTAAALNFNFSQMKFALRQISVEGTTVTQAEINLMQSFLKAPHSMPDHVRNLLGKLVNGDRANLEFNGSLVGNLRANAPNVNLARLTEKWFGGSERPTATLYSENGTSTGLSYAYASGPLFRNGGPSLLDIDQGNIGDCYLMSALGSLAARNPQAIQDMFIDNGDDTFSVRFFFDGRPEYVTVDRYLPVDATGRLVYASEGRLASAGADEAARRPLWAALAEKAFVLACRLNDYGNSVLGTGIDGGSAQLTLGRLANVAATYTNTIVYEKDGNGNVRLDLSGNRIIDRAASIKKVDVFRTALQEPGSRYTVISTADSVTTEKLVNSHAYVLFAANEAGLTLYNPHGASDSIVFVTWAEAGGNIDGCMRY